MSKRKEKPNLDWYNGEEDEARAYGKGRDAARRRAERD